MKPLHIQAKEGNEDTENRNVINQEVSLKLFADAKFVIHLNLIKNDKYYGFCGQSHFFIT